MNAQVWLVYDVARRLHWPATSSYDDEGGEGCFSGYSESEDHELVVHAGTDIDQIRSEMNAYFAVKAKNDMKMTCKFSADKMSSSRSGNYNGGGYMEAYHHYEIRPAPQVRSAD